MRSDRGVWGGDWRGDGGFPGSGSGTRTHSHINQIIRAHVGVSCVTGDIC